MGFLLDMEVGSHCKEVDLESKYEGDFLRLWYQTDYVHEKYQSNMKDVKRNTTVVIFTRIISNSFPTGVTHLARVERDPEGIKSGPVTMSEYFAWSADFEFEKVSYSKPKHNWKLY